MWSNENRSLRSQSAALSERSAPAKRADQKARHDRLLMHVQTTAPLNDPWIPERSATRFREADLNVLSELGKQGLE